MRALIDGLTILEANEFKSENATPRLGIHRFALELVRSKELALAEERYDSRYPSVVDWLTRFRSFGVWLFSRRKTHF